MEKKASDFRYNTGETKVPWAAVGENYNAQDLMTIIRFMMKGKGEAYDEALKTVEKDVLALDKVSAPPAKLSLDVEVGKAENMCDEYLHTTGSTFLTNCTAGFEIACKYTGLKPGDEVIVPAITFAATMAYPLSIGCKLVFADVDPLTLNMDPKDVEKKITDKTKMIIPVHIIQSIWIRSWRWPSSTILSSLRTRRTPLAASISTASSAQSAILARSHSTRSRTSPPLARAASCVPT